MQTLLSARLPRTSGAPRAAAQRRAAASACPLAAPHAAAAAALAPRFRRATRHAAARAASGAVAQFKNILSAEIPVHLPRQDFLKQLFRWAVQDCENGGVEVYQTAMAVEVIDISEVLSIGFAITLMMVDSAGNEVPGLRLECLMDEETVSGYDRVAMGDDGFPVLETLDGQQKPVKGRCFIVRRDATVDVPPSLQAPAKLVINNLMEAVKRYYSFGSCFSEEL